MIWRFSLARWRSCWLCILAAIFISAAFSARTAQAQTHTWDGGGGDNNWSTVANWDAAGAPTQPGTGVANIIFGGTTRLSPFVQAPYDISSITFNNTAGAFIIVGSTLILRGVGAITNNDTQTQTFNAPLIVGANQTWNAAAGNLSYSSVNLNGNNLVVTGGSHFFNGPISGGAGTISKFGFFDSVMRFSSSSPSFSGGVNLHAGIIQINTAGEPTGFPLGTGPLTFFGGSIEALGATRVLANAVNVEADFSMIGDQTLAFNGATTLTGSRTITTLGTGFRIFSGSIGEDVAGRSLTKAGPTTMRFEGGVANTYTGDTRVNAGTLELAKTAGVNAIAGGLLIVGDALGGTNADVVRLLASNQILDSADVLVESSGLFDLNGFSETVNSLLVAGGNVSTGAGTLTLADSVNHSGDAGATSTIAGNLGLGGGNIDFFVEDGSPVVDLVVSAVVSNGSVTKLGGGVLRFSGAAANTHTGTTTINDGTLLLAKPAGVNAVAGPVVVGDGVGADTLQLGGSNQIPLASQPVTVNSSGVFDLAGFNEGLSILTVNGGSVTIGTGTLTISTSMNMTGGSITSAGAGSLLFVADLTTNAATNSATISGNMNLSTQFNDYTIADGSATYDLDISATVTSNNGGFNKFGPGAMRLSGDSANSARATINEGTLVLAKNAPNIAALAGNVVIGDGLGGIDADILRLDQDHQIEQLATDTLTINSSGHFDLNGHSETIGNLLLNAGRMSGGTISFTGSVASSAQNNTALIDSTIDLLGSTVLFSVNDGAAGDDLAIQGVIQNGSFHKSGPGTLKIVGSVPNTASLSQVSAGTVTLEKDAGVNAVAGPFLTIGNGAGPTDVVRYGVNDHQLPDSIQVVVQTGGLFDLNGRSDTIGTLNINGSGLVETGAGTLTVANQVVASLSTTAGTINGKLNLGGGTRPFNIANSDPADDLTIAAAMSNGTLLKQGGGTLALTLSALSSDTSYELDAGSLSASALVLGAERSFTQNLGATFSGSLTNHGLFRFNGGTFSGKLINKLGGATEFNAQFIAGNGITNEGTISIPAGILVAVNGDGLDNQGTIVMAGGTLLGAGTPNYSNANLVTGHGQIQSTSATFVNTGQIVVSGGTLALNTVSNATNQGTISVPASLELKLLGSGILQNQGLVLVTGGRISGPAAISNNLGGTVRGGSSIDAPINNLGGLIHATGTSILTIATLLGNDLGGELRVDHGAAMNVQSGFASSGTIVLAGANATISGGAITNTGTLRGLGRVTNVVANSGTIRAEDGTLTLAALGHTNNFAGRIEAGAGAQVVYSLGLGTNNGQIVLTGGAFDNNNVSLANPGFIGGYGTLRTGALTNTGTISVGGSLDVLGFVTQNATVSTQAGTTVRFFGPVTGPGSYPGPGTVMFLNAFSPGASPAAVSFGGNLALGGSTNLVIELAGTTPGAEYDTLAVAGTATLGGTLDIDLLNGFTPAPGDVFQILTAAGGISGTFSNVLLSSLSSAIWRLRYTATAVELQAGLLGDFNFDGTVDAADYVAWRKTGGTQQEYDEWRANFGTSAAGGASPSAVPAAAVPEPSSLRLLPFLATAFVAMWRSARLVSSAPRRQLTTP